MEYTKCVENINLRKGNIPNFVPRLGDKFEAKDGTATSQLTRHLATLPYLYLTKQMVVQHLKEEHSNDTTLCCGQHDTKLLLTARLIPI